MQEVRIRLYTVGLLSFANYCLGRGCQQHHHRRGGKAWCPQLYICALHRVQVTFHGSVGQSPNSTMTFLDGEGEGFGNKISIQTVAVVKAAKALQRVYKVDRGEPVRELRLAWSFACFLLITPPTVMAGLSHC